MHKAEIITNDTYFVQYGSRGGVSIEDGPVNPHSSTLVTNSLAVTNLFANLAQNLSYKSPIELINYFKPIIEQSSSNSVTSLEKLVSSLFNAITGTAVNIRTDIRNDLYTAIDDLSKNATYAALKGNISIIVGVPSVSEIRSDFGAFLSIYNLTPFVINANTPHAEAILSNAHQSLYNLWIADNLSSNSPLNFSDEWISDRIAMLHSLSLANQSDKPYALSSFVDNESYAGAVFNDISSNASVAVLSGGIGLPAPYNVTFGTGLNDQISGSSGNDRLYGGAGNDSLIGGGGSNYLEGGLGDDSYVIGEGFDVIYDSDGNGSLHANGFILSGGSYSEALGSYINIPERVRYTYDVNSNSLKVYRLDESLLISSTLIAEIKNVKSNDDFTPKNTLGLTFSKSPNEENAIKGSAAGVTLNGGTTPGSPMLSPFLGNGSTFKGMAAAFDRLSLTFVTRARKDPLVLDLNLNNKIDTISSTSGAYFDVDSDGLVGQSSWVSPSDGLVVIDKNYNGKIDDSTELFGDAYELKSGAIASNGYEALADLDSNGDGIFSELDDEFNSVKIWQDLNSDGISDSNELHSLSYHNIKSISVTYSSVFSNIGNNVIAIAKSTALLTNGQSMLSMSVLLPAESGEFHVSELSYLTVNSEIKELPNISGRGKVVSLHQAMAGNPELVNKINEYITSDVSTLKSQYLGLISEWAGVGLIDPNSSEYSIRTDAWSGSLSYFLSTEELNKLSIVNKFLGRSFFEQYSPGTPRVEFSSIKRGVLSAYDIIENYVINSILPQSHLKNLWQLTAIKSNAQTGEIYKDYSEIANTLIATLASDFKLGIYLFDLFIHNAYATGEAQEESFKSTFLPLISKYPELIAMNKMATEFNREYEIVFDVNGQSSSLRGTIVYGGNGNDTINGSLFEDVLYGGDGDDNIKSTPMGNYGAWFMLDTDTLIGGKGNDTLEGSSNANIYIFNLGDGHDTIREWDIDYSTNNRPIDRLIFGEGINPADIKFSSVNNAHLVLKINDNDSITLINWLDQIGSVINKVDLFEFSDGTTWDIPYIQSRISNYSGTSSDDTLTAFHSYFSVTINGMDGDDNIIGSEVSDVLMGGSGSDTINGNGGSDTFIGGEGNDTLIGGLGSDTYIFNLGDGHDTIAESDAYGYSIISTDVLKFGQGILPENVNVSHSEYDLILTVNQSDSVTIKNWITSESDLSKKIERIEFQDGTLWTPAFLTNKINTLTGSDSSETLRSPSNYYYSYLEGKKGDDVLIGGASNTYYKYNVGDGHDTIIETSPEGIWGIPVHDSVIFGEGISKEDISFERVGYDLIASITASDRGSITIKNWWIPTKEGTPLNNMSNTVESFQFSDGSSISAIAATNSIVNAFSYRILVYGTEDRDIIAYSSIIDPSNIYGLGGDDNISVNYSGMQVLGGDGDDIILSSSSTYSGVTTSFKNGKFQVTIDPAIQGNTIEGGKGNDIITSSTRNTVDTYVMNRGDGQDTVIDASSGNILSFGEGISAADLSVHYMYQDPNLANVGVTVFVDENTLIFFKTNFTNNLSSVLSSIKFYDGTELTTAQIANATINLDMTLPNSSYFGVSDTSNTLISLGGSSLIGGAFNDVLISRANILGFNSSEYGGKDFFSPDYLEGGLGFDKYVFNGFEFHEWDSGFDTIRDEDGQGVIVIDGIEISSLIYDTGASTYFQKTVYRTGNLGSDGNPYYVFVDKDSSSTSFGNMQIYNQSKSLIGSLNLANFSLNSNYLSISFEGEGLGLGLGLDRSDLTYDQITNPSIISGIEGFEYKAIYSDGTRYLKEFNKNNEVVMTTTINPDGTIHRLISNSIVAGTSLIEFYLSDSNSVSTVVEDVEGGTRTQEYSYYSVSIIDKGFDGSIISSKVINTSDWTSSSIYSEAGITYFKDIGRNGEVSLKFINPNGVEGYKAYDPNGELIWSTETTTSILSSDSSKFITTTLDLINGDRSVVIKLIENDQITYLETTKLDGSSLGSFLDSNGIRVSFVTTSSGQKYLTRDNASGGTTSSEYSADGTFVKSTETGWTLEGVYFSIETDGETGIRTTLEYWNPGLSSIAYKLIEYSDGSSESFNYAENGIDLLQSLVVRSDGTSTGYSINPELGIETITERNPDGTGIRNSYAVSTGQQVESTTFSDYESYQGWTIEADGYTRHNTYYYEVLQSWYLNNSNDFINSIIFRGELQQERWVFESKYAWIKAYNGNLINDVGNADGSHVSMYQGSEDSENVSIWSVTPQSKITTSIIIPGKGNDRISVSSNSNMLLVANAVDGNDTIVLSNNYSKTITVALGGVLAENIMLSKVNYNLIVSTSAMQSVTFFDWFNGKKTSNLGLELDLSALSSIDKENQQLLFNDSSNSIRFNMSEVVSDFESYIATNSNTSWSALSSLVENKSAALNDNVSGGVISRDYFQNGTITLTNEQVKNQLMSAGGNISNGTLFPV